MALDTLQQFHLSPADGVSTHISAWGKDEYSKPIELHLGVVGGMGFDVRVELTMERAEELADALNEAIQHAEANGESSE